MACDESGRTIQPDESHTFVEWREMEELLEDVRQGRVCNFSIKTLTELLPRASVVPAVNQVKLHPCLLQHELFELCSAVGHRLLACQEV
ncbi:hypothetical protein OH76DRAFT_50855 [Lentinus brumalis]|uniref:NADP-dependent oxidoreductase domain-containing protein n=1 Tax=Lentinus brumalis TaxID=2498619 RepID=A0A371DYD9_9APHY|nr:hypothetical protein OH76DRAFT_50855 [Polyporus brumalis]